MAAGRHLENRFGVYISTIYCPINAKFGIKKQDHVRHRSQDQNTKFRKFKTADGRHFENVFFRSISAENNPISTKFFVQMQILVPITATSQNIKILQIQYGGRPPYWKSFLGISQQFIVRLTRNLARRSKNKLDTGHMTKMPNFENWRWRTAAILKIVLSIYRSRKSSDFNEIWYADADCAFKVGYLTKC